MDLQAFRTAIELVLAVCAVLAIVWKILLPKIRDEVLGEIKSVGTELQDVKRLVGENHHANPARPTMPDRLETAASTITETLSTATASINRRLDQLDAQQRQLVQQYKDDKADTRTAQAVQAAELVDLHGMLASHLGWSNEETRRLWTAIGESSTPAGS